VPLVNGVKMKDGEYEEARRRRRRKKRENQV
jgi:hypothetical protein